MSFPNGCHVCEVEIDPDTGAVRWSLRRSTTSATWSHPVIVEGQIHGGVAQGLGQVLGERVVYGEVGPAPHGSFMDYAMPRADDLPPLAVHHHHVVPCTTNPLGGGEACRPPRTPPPAPRMTDRSISPAASPWSLAATAASA